MQLAYLLLFVQLQVSVVQQEHIYFKGSKIDESVRLFL